MLSMLLEDFLSEDEAPDLKSRIIGCLNKAVIENSRCTSEEYDNAIQAASMDMENGYGTVIPPPIEDHQKISKLADDDNSHWIRRGAYFVAALAAAVLGVCFLPGALTTWTTPGTQAKIAVKAEEPKTNVASNQTASGEIEVGANPKDLTAAATQADASTKQIDAPPEKVAFNQQDKSNSPIASVVVANVPSTSVPIEGMADQEIVEVIDTQLRYLWKRVGVTAASSIPVDAWLDRSAMSIVGRQATAAEKEAFRSNKSESRIFNYVDNFISSSEFNRHWSLKLAEHYLGKRLSVSRDLSASEFAFLDWLEQSLAGKAFVGDLERLMVDGTESIGIRNDAAANWLGETIERTMAIQRDSIDQLVATAKRRSPREESLIGVSRQLMRISGNPSMVCTQCHTGEENGSDMRGYVAMPKSQAGAGSSEFWSVPANLSGVTLVSQAFGRTLRIEPPVDYFFEDAEGRMTLAVAGPPSLRKQPKPTKTLGQWFSTSAEPRRAVVEMVWGQIFKQPLVPAIGLTDDEGFNERVDLLELLASQMHSRKADLGTLVRWIVLSKGFRIEGLKTDAPWYLKSTEAQIAAAQRQMRLFAGFPATDSLVSDSGKLPAGKIAAWMDQKRSFKNGDGTLAQGAGFKPQASYPKANKIDYTEEQVRYFVSVEQPYSQLRLLAERLAGSSMNWQMLLEHAYLATDARLPTRSEREEGNKVLESTGKDRAKTLVMIVNARLGSW
jgi:hypothetical protein